MTIRVVTAEQSSARDAAAIAAGTASVLLMERAGAACAGAILRRYRRRLADGVVLYAGSGNNGGDAWVVARLLAAEGVGTRVVEVGESRTDDARAMRERARPLVSLGASAGALGVVVDGVLGTGARGAARGAAATAIDAINAARERGADVVALDVPSGLDATTGEGDRCVVADLTVTFGTVKRGLLRARSKCGEILAMDIGLAEHDDLDDGAPELIDAAWTCARVPPIVAEAHKGTRRRIGIVGGSEGMAGATALAARGALRSGVGMLRLVVQRASIPAVQSAVVEAIALAWPDSREAFAGTMATWAHALLMGPGLGLGDHARPLVDLVSSAYDGPLVLDADALTVFTADLPGLAAALRGRGVITPHAVEAARLTNSTPAEVDAGRYTVARQLAAAIDGVVLLKGVPTIIAAPDGRMVVSASGTPALATAGSGDLLGGILTTLVAQTGNAFESAACAAWVHGRAAEIASRPGPVRGVTLADVLDALPEVWSFEDRKLEAPILARLPRVGDRA
jgi:ADP-dependent NAD(P)H-hydrate dehydratase / NAD(P)H-hydrate epimerase